MRRLGGKQSLVRRCRAVVGLLKDEEPEPDPRHMSDRDVLWLIHGSLRNLTTQTSRQNQLLRIVVMILGVIAAGRAAFDAVTSLGV